MAAKVPIRTVYTNSVATGLAEFQSGEFIDYTSGGTGLASVVTSNTVTLNADFYLSGGAMEGDNVVYNGTSWDPIESPCLNLIVSATGNSAYRFSGSGVNTTTDNPTIYVYRGFTYRFNNETGAAHPFALRTTSGGGSVTDGVSGSQEGVQLWTIPQSLSAGTTYVYQCTMHPAMVGNLVVV